MLRNFKLYLEGGGKSLKSFKLVGDVIRNADWEIPSSTGMWGWPESRAPGVQPRWENSLGRGLGAREQVRSRVSASWLSGQREESPQILGFWEAQLLLRARTPGRLDGEDDDRLDRLSCGVCGTSKEMSAGNVHLKSEHSELSSASLPHVSGHRDCEVTRSQAQGKAWSGRGGRRSEPWRAACKGDDEGWPEVRGNPLECMSRRD